MKTKTNFAGFFSNLETFLKLDLFPDWIQEICSFWEENDNVQPSTNLALFVLELTSIISKSEERFLQLSSENVYLKLCDVLHVRRHTCPTQIRLAYIKLLEAFLEHR